MASQSKKRKAQVEASNKRRLELLDQCNRASEIGMRRGLALAQSLNPFQRLENLEDIPVRSARITGRKVDSPMAGSQVMHAERGGENRDNKEGIPMAGSKRKAVDEERDSVLDAIRGVRDGLKGAVKKYAANGALQLHELATDTAATEVAELVPAILGKHAAPERQKQRFGNDAQMKDELAASIQRESVLQERLDAAEKGRMKAEASEKEAAEKAASKLRDAEKAAGAVDEKITAMREAKEGLEVELQVLTNARIDEAGKTVELQEKLDSAMRVSEEVLSLRELDLQQKLRDVEQQRDLASAETQKLRAELLCALEKHAATESHRKQLEIELQAKTTQHKGLESNMESLHAHLRVGEEHQAWLLKELMGRDESIAALHKNAKQLGAMKDVADENIRALSEKMVRAWSDMKGLSEVFAEENRKLARELDESKEQRAHLAMSLQEQVVKFRKVEKSWQ